MKVVLTQWRWNRLKSVRYGARKPEQAQINRSWAPWFVRKVGERRWPNAPF